MSAAKMTQRLALFSIPIALIVMGIKYWAYSITGSVALYSDALESVVNVIAAIAAYCAIRVSLKPADENHPFGHHKAEYFSAVIEGALIMVAALLIIREAWGALNIRTLPTQPWIGLAINMVATLINGVWAFILIRAGRRYRSPALDADGRHILSDVITSAGVFVGLVAAFLSGWAILDPLLALFVAVNILWQGWKVVNSSVQGLMDVGLSAEETAQIREIVSMNAEGAIEAHDLRTRSAGQVTFIEFHLVMASDKTVAQSHEICDRIENALKKQIGNVEVIIHVEPENEAKLPEGTIRIPFA